MSSIPLGSLEVFAIFSKTKITIDDLPVNPPTTVTGDVGVPPPGGTIIGFPPGTLVGTSHLNNAIATQAQSDLTTAYSNAQGQTYTSDLTGMNLGGMTLPGGVYLFTGDAPLSGIVTLSGGPSAIYVFQIGANLQVGANSTVLLTNGTECKNIFWQVTGNATLKPGTTFIGNVLAGGFIDVDFSNVDGRLLSKGGDVNVASSTVTNENCFICVHEDTLIHTQNGLKAIKDVYVGDFVYDSSDRMTPILKNIHGGYSQTFVKISKDAFATNVPSHDTLISGPHPISLNGEEILPFELVNGTTITLITTDLYVKVYSIMISERIPIKMNNMLIYSWGSEEYEKFCECNDKQFDFQ